MSECAQCSTTVAAQRGCVSQLTQHVGTRRPEIDGGNTSRVMADANTDHENSIGEWAISNERGVKASLATPATRLTRVGQLRIRPSPQFPCVFPRGVRLPRRRRGIRQTKASTCGSLFHLQRRYEGSGRVAVRRLVVSLGRPESGPGRPALLDQQTVANIGTRQRGGWAGGPTANRR